MALKLWHNRLGCAYTDSSRQETIPTEAHFSSMNVSSGIHGWLLRLRGANLHQHIEHVRLACVALSGFKMGFSLGMIF